MLPNLLHIRSKHVVMKCFFLMLYIYKVRESIKIFTYSWQESLNPPPLFTYASFVILYPTTSSYNNNVSRHKEGTTISYL